MAQIETPFTDDRMIAAATGRAHKALWPAPVNHGLTALLLRAEALLKLGKAQPLAELDPIACNINLLATCNSANILRVLRQTRGQTVEEQG